jgi:transposase, IS30 family
VLIDVAENYSKRMLGEVVHKLWDLKAAGVPTEVIAPQIGWSTSAVGRHVREYGGVRPRWGRDLKGRSLSIGERETILELRRTHSIREIARRLSRAPSTISRELKRHTDPKGKYQATRAHARAFENARRPKKAKLAGNEALRKRVQQDLENRLSPEQISGRLRKDFPDQPEMQVSHETIYQSLYLLSRGGLKRELVTRLRTGRTLRNPKRKPDERRGKIKDMILIADRPPEAADRAVPGHWEGDLIIGKDGQSAIGTVVERRSGYLILVHLTPGRNRVDAVHDGLIKKMSDLPDHLRRTLTWDQGIEMHRHKEVKMAADIDIYFCDPHSPWQRPTNENTNGLLRQYFPKSTDLSGYSEEDLDFVAWQMNERPRKRLDFATPNEKIKELLLR